MASITLTPSEKDIQAFLEHYQTSLAPSKNPYIRYFLKLPQATVSIYTSGKILLQGEGAEKYASFFGYQAVEQTSGQNLPLIGTDEVGNGSYFGGLAVVATFVTPDQHDFLRKLGVGDSKTLTDQKIRQITPILKEKIQHQALLLSPSKYNEVIGDRYNAVSVKVALHNQAIYLLLQKGVQPEKIVIDAFTSAKNYDKYLAQEANRFSNPISLEEKAEGKYLSVAVSSVIARDLFLENLENLGRELGYQLPSGAGTASDKVASQILQAYGMQGLSFCAKLHFKNTEKAKKRLER
ncbi:ribonuclease HIII [Streptococcus pneumoniae]|uniref:Ribonuclease HIII n=3 Tax=Streptococcus pneumoniae TaxID=1313 RepID=RNH3_STRP7|nr:ribonuclease HIII [Streptococcus pneumoniae]C1C5E1.1 RecName: Full=Ribonuclease HIII; Short=RNase HIII [Streptococcus pneumoniae 70585]ACO16696.1 ribonuclease hiii [Streptococcus pneumoniae 70585]MBW5024744.1 ribonuclease HIII [Streptococcus pneumoniae]MDS2268242.1 ribonuclease HIII [Streptococcus pneumoniae]MDS2709502.1 ribonuclease HIII [Streptococcus pneumoniae]MDS2907925.1 ribonuclease HIII [Streptococcus pneumoniae]